MKYLLNLLMSLLSFLFGCTSKKAPEKPVEWPRFPATDNQAVQVIPVVPDSSFQLVSFMIAPDRQNVYMLVSRSPESSRVRAGGEPRPGPPDYMDYRLYRLDTHGKVQQQVDMFGTDWMGGGTLGILENEFMLRIGDWFLVIDPVQLAITDKIPVHDSAYIPWKEEEMTRDEHQVDYQRQFDQLYNNPDSRWLYWPASREYLVFIQGKKGARSAWSPMSYEDELLAGLQQHFAPINVQLNPAYTESGDNSPFQVTDHGGVIMETGYLSGGTQLDYPNYKTRQVLQYQCTVNGQQVRFSTTDRDRHDLHLGFSDNLLLNTEDGAVWISFEGVVYRLKEKNK
jgi:hypothetical protein